MRRDGLLGVTPTSFTAACSFPLRPVPRGLTLDRVARSHGWVGLPPYGYDVEARRFFATLTLGTVRVDRSWTVSVDRVLSAAEIADLRSTLRWCLGLDDDVAGSPPAVRSTRMLRSATVWEDLAKTLMTTNCSWSATIGMVTRLVENLGTAGCFPAATVVAEAGAGALSDVVRMGYRSASLARVAELIAAGELDPEAWRGLPDEEIVGQVLALPGFGPYAAEGMLGLLGRPRGLAVDSWIRARLGGITAAEITERYGVHGRWAGAVLWQDVTADWFTPVRE